MDASSWQLRGAVTGTLIGFSTPGKVQMLTLDHERMGVTRKTCTNTGFLHETEQI